VAWLRNGEEWLWRWAACFLALGTGSGVEWTGLGVEWIRRGAACFLALRSGLGLEWSGLGGGLPTSWLLEVGVDWLRSAVA
jgi:hypothetical protein